MGAKYDQLDLDKHIEMSRLYEAGTSRREIGRIIGRSASTVGRELRRIRCRGAAISPLRRIGLPYRGADGCPASSA